MCFFLNFFLCVCVCVVVGLFLFCFLVICSIFGSFFTGFATCLASMNLIIDIRMLINPKTQGAPEMGREMGYG